MFLYRPFLHYISHSNIQSNFSREAYAYAAECVDTSRRVIQNIQAMKEGNILNGPYWFCSYTTFCATVSLIFHVWENVEVEGALFTLRDAEYGREILRSLASKSLAANKNSEILAVSKVSSVEIIINMSRLYLLVFLRGFQKRKNRIQEVGQEAMCLTKLNRRSLQQLLAPNSWTARLHI